jgi:hypothetical protein
VLNESKENAQSGTNWKEFRMARKMCRAWTETVKGEVKLVNELNMSLGSIVFIIILFSISCICMS